MNRFLRANIIRNDSEIETLRTNETLSTSTPSQNCFYAWFVAGAGVTNKYTTVDGSTVEASTVTNTIQPPRMGAEYRGMLSTNVPLSNSPRGILVDNQNGFISTEALNLQPQGTKIFVLDEPASFNTTKFNSVSQQIRNPILDALPALQYKSIDGAQISRTEKIEEIELLFDGQPDTFWTDYPGANEENEEALMLIGAENDFSTEYYFALLDGVVFCVGPVHVVDELLGVAASMANSYQPLGLCADYLTYKGTPCNREQKIEELVSFLNDFWTKSVEEASDEEYEALMLIGAEEDSDLYYFSSVNCIVYCFGSVEEVDELLGF